MPHAKPPRRPSHSLRRSIAIALGVALISASTLAGAETAKEKELEARVAELEKLVQKLAAEKIQNVIGITRLGLALGRYLGRFALRIDADNRRLNHFRDCGE
jgi:hypothetical protein